MTGFLTLVTGPMFSGKSRHLIAAINADPSGVLALKPAFDTRGGTHLTSRAADPWPARDIASWPNDTDGASLIVIDEVHFLCAPHYEGDIVADIAHARSRGARLLVAGLDTDYRRTPFAITERLSAIADRHERLLARCHVCGDAAPWTAKRAETGALLETGDAELYEARCEQHFTLP